MSYWDYYEPSRPREAKGGIKSQSSRAGFASNWWAKRWIQVLDSCGLGARLTRGRSYARQGQVLSIDIQPGAVNAAVQGSRPKPYKVTIKVKPIAPESWERVVEALGAQASFAAKLLAGEMPQDIESVFEGAGQSLFPSSMRELDTDCSCPDYSNPCKHTAAVYCLLGEEFDRDPFLLFTLRGMTQEDLRTRLAGASADSAEPEIASPEPLASNPGEFWSGRPLKDPDFGAVQAPPVSAPLLRRLGGFPFWRGDVPLLEAVGPLYSAASEAGLNLFLAENKDRNSEAVA